MYFYHHLKNLIMIINIYNTIIINYHNSKSIYSFIENSNHTIFITVIFNFIIYILFYFNPITITQKHHYLHTFLISSYSIFNTFSLIQKYAHFMFILSILFHLITYII